MHTVTRCAICSGVKKHGIHLHYTHRICKSLYKIANALTTKMFKCCASSQTVILWSSHTIMAAVFCKILFARCTRPPSCGLPTSGGKNIYAYRKILNKVGNTLIKFLDIPKRNFVTFLRKFLEKLVKNYPKNVKLFWENLKIIWRNYKIIIFGIFWKFLWKYVRQVSFVKQIVNYLLKTLKKCWRFVENFWGISDWLRRSIWNIFMKSRKNFQKIVGKITE